MRLVTDSLVHNMYCNTVTKFEVRLVEFKHKIQTQEL